MPKKAHQPAATPGYDWSSFARTAGGVVGDLFGGPSAASPHTANSDAHTKQETAGGFSLFDVFANPAQALGDLGHAVQQEGLGAFGDLAGAMDRQDAQRDLASRFNVEGNGLQVGTADNDVTQDQFLAIARQYSDIRRGNSQIKLSFDEPGADPTRKAMLENRAMADLADIMQTGVGRDMLGELARSKFETRIGEEDVMNARGGGKVDERTDEYLYNYAMYQPGEIHRPGRGDFRSDVTLFHELTHAYHAGKQDFAKGSVSSQGLTPPMPGDEGKAIDRSEYQAVGLQGFATQQYTENAYRDARALLSSGNRTLGGADQQLTSRDHYSHPNDTDDEH